MELQVKIDGIEFVIDLINDFMKEAEFKENVTEDYKEGFYDFGNAIIKVLENR